MVLPNKILSFAIGNVYHNQIKMNTCKGEGRGLYVYSLIFIVPKIRLFKENLPALKFDKNIILLSHLLQKQFISSLRMKLIFSRIIFINKVLTGLQS